MQCAVSRLPFWEQLFTAVYSAKHAYYLLSVGVKIRELSRLKDGIIIAIEEYDEQETWTSNLLNPKVSSEFIIVFLQS